MNTLSNWILISITALIIDLTIGEFKFKHPVQYLGDLVNIFEARYYQNSFIRGTILLLSLILIALIVSLFINFVILNLVYIFNIPSYIYAIATGIIASTGLSSKGLKDHVFAVLNAAKDESRSKLSYLVTRNTDLLSDEMVYKSLLETHSENLSDGFIAPLFYLILFGLPGIAVYKTVSTLDSMIGYKNDKYLLFGKSSAIADDILNYIPSRITAILIMIVTNSFRYIAQIIIDAKRYSSSPNAGFPVAAAAYSTETFLGGVIYYGTSPVTKGIIGIDKNLDPQISCVKFIETHNKIEGIIIFLLLLSFITTSLLKI